MKMIRLLKHLCVALLLIVSLPLLGKAAEPYHNLTLEVSGTNQQAGQLLINVFDSENSFLASPVISKTTQVESTKNIILLQGLTEGQYAVSVVYDEDSSGEINTGFLGIPTELVGFSLNAKKFFGPPDFEDAAFALTKNLTLKIQLGKAKD
jgi:uncharacterized protein (DUF2141 family)